MKKKVVLIIGIIICTTLGVLGFIQNKNKLNTPLDNKENTNQDNDNNNQEENAEKTYEAKKYIEGLVFEPKYSVNIYSDSKGIYLVDNRYYNENKFFYTLKDNKIVSTEKFTSGNKDYFCNDDGCKFSPLKVNEGFTTKTYGYLRYSSGENFVAANKGERGVGVLTKKGDIVLDYLYDEIGDNNFLRDDEYFFVKKGKKTGVANVQRGIVLDTEFDIIYDNKIYKLDDKYYFFLSKKGEKYLYNSDGKLVYEFKDYYEYSFAKYYDNFIIMNIENEIIKSLDFYDKNFKHIKNENLEQYNIKYSDVTESKYASDSYELKHTSILNLFPYQEVVNVFPLKDNKALVIDKDLNIKQIENLFSDLGRFYEKTYFYSEYYYVTYNGEEDNITYNIYSSKGELIVNNLFKVHFIFPSGDNEYGDGSLVICKEDTKCAVMNKYGKIITDYKYSNWDEYDNDIVILTNDNETYIYSMNDKIKDRTCNIKISGSMRYISNDCLKIYDVLYDSNCEKIGEGYSYILDRYNDILFVEKEDGTLLVIKNKETVYKSDAKVGNTKIIDNKFFFIMNNSLYYIEL